MRPILATAAIVDLIVFLSIPSETYHTALTFSLAKLYSNSLLVLFNNRSYIKTSEVLDISLDTTSTGPRFRDTARRASEAFSLPPSGIHVNVQQTTFIAADDIPLEDRVCLQTFEAPFGHTNIRFSRRASKSRRAYPQCQCTSRPILLIQHLIVLGCCHQMSVVFGTRSYRPATHLSMISTSGSNACSSMSRRVALNERGACDFPACRAAASLRAAAASEEAGAVG